MMSLVATSELPVTTACTRAGPPPPSFGPGSSLRPYLPNTPIASAIALKDSEGSGVGSSSVALIAVGVPAVCAWLTAGAAAIAAAVPANTRKAAVRRSGAVVLDISISLKPPVVGDTSPARRASPAVPPGTVPYSILRTSPIRPVVRHVPCGRFTHAASYALRRHTRFRRSWRPFQLMRACAETSAVPEV